ncbi:transmembrane adaptor Erv26 [Podospora conica]|nr:transmembrane adaptor Erv26 [Schizothecium conicum]
MWILPLVGYVGTVVSFCFLALAIASGLYYLSELVEEHTVMAKRFLTRLIYFVMGTLALLCLVDGFPVSLTALAIFSHAVYLANMRRFPYVTLSDPLFISSAVLVVANHWLWFRHVSRAHTRAYETMASYYDGPSNLPNFSQVASFFGLCVWLVPFALFISLSASENVLPTMGTTEIAGADAAKSRRGQGMVKAFLDNILRIVAEAGAALGYRRREDDRL